MNSKECICPWWASVGPISFQHWDAWFLLSQALKFLLDACHCRNLICSRNSPRPYLDTPGQDRTMAKKYNLGGKMYEGKYSLLNGVTTWRSWSVVPRGCVNRIRLGPLGVMTTKAFWLASTRVGVWCKHEDQSIAHSQRAIDCTRAWTCFSLLLHHHEKWPLGVQLQNLLDFHINFRFDGHYFLLQCFKQTLIISSLDVRFVQKTCG